MASKSKRATRQPTVEQLKKDAALLFKTIHDERISEDVREIVQEYVQDIYSDVPETWPHNNRSLFIAGFVKGWKRQDTHHARRNVGQMLDRLKSGESAESIIEEWEGRREANRQRSEDEMLSAPEPKDRASNEWRYWKLRRMERALRGQEGEKAQREARREFKRIAREAINIAASNRYHAEMMLPQFIIAIQQKGGASDEN
jgi:hypothetical protein